MLVLIDMEWDALGDKIMPTQLSALRVFPDWRTLARFDALIQPLNEPDWSFMAYNGYSPDDFRRAPRAASVLNRLTYWLSPKDTLCWWTSEPAEKFIALYKLLLKKPPRFQMRTLAPSVFAVLDYIGILERPSLYRCKALLNLDEKGIEHCAKDDVGLIQAILSKLNVNETRIQASHLPPHTYDKTVWSLQRQAQSGGHRAGYGFTIDLVTHTVHADLCPKIDPRHAYEEVYTIRKCMRKGLRPCSCCKDAFWAYSREAIQRNIRSCQFNYVFSPSGLFHKPSCIHVRYIPAAELLGSVRYGTATLRGGRPCGWCKPSKKDEIEPIYSVPKPKPAENITPPLPRPERGSPNDRKQRAEASKIKNAPFPSTRTLSQEELRALQRHKEAAEERATLPEGLTGTESHDAHVLTQSGFAFWAGKGYKTFHLRQCPKLGQLSNLYGYATFAEARKHHLTPCRLCKPTAKFDIPVSVPIYHRHRETETVEDLDRLCEELRWQHTLENGNTYCIETLVGRWKLIVGTSPVDVYHINKVKTPNNVKGYHKQHRLFLSMTDTIEYIRRHDGKLIEELSSKVPEDVFDVEVPEIGMESMPLAV